MDHRWITVGEAALLLRCSEKTVYRMIDAEVKWLIACRRPPRGTWLLERRSVELAIGYDAAGEAAER
jgi:excisionase family DNA binding protein